MSKEIIRKYDKNNNLIYEKYSSGKEFWYKSDENNDKIIITKKEYKEIEFQRVKKLKYKRKKEKRSYRFEIMDI